MGESQAYGEDIKMIHEVKFSEDIRNFFFCTNILKFDILFNDLFSNKMIFDQNVFCFLMHDRILGDVDGTSVVTEYGNRLTELYLKILQSLFHPNDLSTT